MILKDVIGIMIAEYLNFIVSWMVYLVSYQVFCHLPIQVALLDGPGMVRYGHWDAVLGRRSVGVSGWVKQKQSAVSTLRVWTVVSVGFQQ